MGLARAGRGRVRLRCLDARRRAGQVERRTDHRRSEKGIKLGNVAISIDMRRCRHSRDTNSRTFAIPIW